MNSVPVTIQIRLNVDKDVTGIDGLSDLDNFLLRFFDAVEAALGDNAVLVDQKFSDGVRPLQHFNREEYD